jgi:ribosomal protein S7
MQSKLLINKLTSLFMKNGNKKKVSKKVMFSLQNFNEEMTYKQLCLLTILFLRNRPVFETRSVTRGRQSYNVPFLVKPYRSLSIVLRWFVYATRYVDEVGLSQKITTELKNVIFNKGNTIRESKILRKRVFENLKYSHYRW